MVRTMFLGAFIFSFDRIRPCSPSEPGTCRLDSLCVTVPGHFYILENTSMERALHGRI